MCPGLSVIVPPSISSIDLQKYSFQNYTFVNDVVRGGTLLLRRLTEVAAQTGQIPGLRLPVRARLTVQAG
jgi:hypothetical protein